MYSFEETQRFRQWWIWAILALAVGIEVYLFVSRVNTDHHGFWIVKLLILVLVIALMLFIRLETKVDATGVYYKFFPVHLGFKKIDWEEVAEAYVRQYSPIGEYGGWGIRLSFKRGKAYNIAGNKGLQLVFKNGKQTLIGTQRPEELNNTLQGLISSRLINVTGRIDPR
ncbi:MAG: hypothetical protein JSS82_07440 [Bacteroidetes bacterium]|nr:hypothetical protein [Bacteroidota bacterium]